MAEVKDLAQELLLAGHVQHSIKHRPKIKKNWN